MKPLAGNPAWCPLLLYPGLQTVSDYLKVPMNLVWSMTRDLAQAGPDGQQSTDLRRAGLFMV